MAAQLRYREPELRHGYSYEDNLHSDYPPDPEYYCEYITTNQSFMLNVDHRFYHLPMALRLDTIQRMRL